MGAWGRLGRAWKAGLLLAAGAAGGAAAVAVASVPDSNGVIHACYQVTAGSTVPVTTTANLTIIDPSAGQKCNTVGSPGALASQASIAWNQQGPQGLQGPPGAAGKSNTIAAGNTLTIGGSVVTVGAPSGLTINSPSVGPGSPPIGTATVSGLGSFNILSLSLGSGNPTGRAGIHDIVIVKTQDKSSPLLFRACVAGAHIPKVVLHLRKSGGGQSGGGKSGGAFLQYTLRDVLISSYQLGGHGGAKPTETVTINYSSIKISYTKQD